MQHGIDRCREQRQISQPRGTKIRKQTPNSLHLDWCEGITFANVKALILGLMLICRLLVAGHLFAFL